MTFTLHRAERADVLADALADLLLAPPADPFAPEVVAVHSRGIERWLAHRLGARLGASPGRADGVCAHLELPFPGRLVQDVLAQVTGVDPGTDPWRPERLAWPLLQVIDAHVDEPWLRLLRSHVGGSDGAEDDRRRDRRFAAARHLADLFDRYAVHRPAMVQAWAEGRDEDGTGALLPEDARWQARLWRELRSAVGVAGPAERAITGRVALEADPAAVDLPERLCLFGLTRLPASYLDVLGSLAVHREVHVFALHPSPAAWAADDLEQLRHPLLRAWGRDSHEMATVLRGRIAANHGWVDRHHEPGPGGADHGGEPSLLARIQRSIVADEPVAPTADPAVADPAAALPVLAATDRSVQVHACHGRARQAEVVRDAVTHLLADDPTLEPRDVVILCPDIDEFAPLLRAAFDDVDPERAIPYRLADRALRQTNPVLGAVAELLGLVEDRLAASSVLAFAALPPVRRRFRFDDDDLERLAGWVQATGIRWGLDAAHRARYDLGSVETGTWEAGLRRLLLGVTMAEDDHRIVGGVLPVDEVDSRDIDLVGRFAELVARLGASVRDLASPRPAEAWADAVDRAAGLLLDTTSADAWQRAQLDRLLADVRDEAGPGGPALRLAELRDLLADRLQGQPSRAAFRTGELTMCTLVPMRSVPHRVVCLVGLDDGAFPRGGAVDGDDLLLRHRQPGDHDRRTEDRQLLLDAVLAARDALVITYAGRDARTNEVLPPAVPVDELLEVVDATVAGPDGAARPASAAITTHHPFQPTDRRCFEPRALGAGGPWSFDRRHLAGAEAAAGPRHRVAPLLAGSIPARPEPVVALADLVAVLHHPLRALLRQRLDLHLGSWDDATADALTVELDGLGRWAVGERLLQALLAGEDPATVAAAEVARGLVPAAVLDAGELDATRAAAEQIAAAAAAVASGPRTSLEIDVALAGGRRLVGVVPDVVGTVIRPVTFSGLKPKHRLTAWAHLLAATASHPERGLTATTVTKRATFALPAIDPAVARVRLAELVALRDEALAGPIPLYCATSFAYAEATRRGRDGAGPAEREWTSTWGFDKEDRQPEHQIVLRDDLSIRRLLDDPGFAATARRLWDPILDHVESGQARR